jgi:hypothetical protein
MWALYDKAGGFKAGISGDVPTRVEPRKAVAFRPFTGLEAAFYFTDTIGGYDEKG